MSHRGPGPIPNRWLRCPRKSETVISERFIAFKTPLDERFNSQVPIECRFTPTMMFDWCKSVNIKLGLWIDLTNTKRFYDSSFVESRNARYIKLQCRGHAETPSPEQTQSFIDVVESFINERPFDIIAVHCTHGFNRTGFLIISYLVERLDCSVEAAISLFTKARPPGIYKQDYIDELFRRYEPTEAVLQAPVMPDWCLDYDDSNRNCKRTFNEAHTSTSHQAVAARGQQHSNHFGNGVELDEKDPSDGDSEGQSPQKKRRRGEMFIKNAIFMAGVPGVMLVTDQQRLAELQLKVQQMCGWKKNGFPGSQPVSMDCKNVKRLKEIPYRVSWKADGSRYMMLINKRDEIYFFDRNYSCFQVENLSFVKSKDLQTHLENTLLDGEMVLDKHNGKTIPRYLIYDIITISNAKVGSKPFYPNRLACIKQEIIEPRYEAMRKGIISRESEPFGVRNKEFWYIDTAASLLSEKFAKNLAHEPDGLIFQPSKQPYTAGVCPDVLKWKPSNMNSVDFLVKIGVDGGKGFLPQKMGFLFVGGQDIPFGKIKCTKQISQLDNKIIECTVNAQGNWEFMRERTDKKMPNSYNTAVAVMESIYNPVTKDYLLGFIASNGYPDDQDKMLPPPPPQPPQQEEFGDFKKPQPPHQQQLRHQ